MTTYTAQVERVWAVIEPRVKVLIAEAGGRQSLTGMMPSTMTLAQEYASSPNKSEIWRVGAP